MSGRPNGTRPLHLLIATGAGLLLAATAAGAQQRAENPHGAIRFECSECHTPAGWTPLLSPLGFSHEETDFPLRASHVDLGCRSCHGDLSLAPPREDRDCASCHMADFEHALEPDHQAAGLPKACWGCHTERSWSPASSFDHTLTGFVLEGGHRHLDCSSCHADGFTATTIDCFSCHQDDFRSAADPNHVAAGFATTCESCHGTQAWEPATFDHALTAFPLQGAHRGADCASCHANGFSGTPSECFACHQSEYQDAEPDHVAAGFDTTCETCHTSSAWQPATFDHDLTAFPLQGAHRGTDCTACHTDGYSGTPSDCFACHQNDFQSAADPNHISAGFETTCETCHTANAWQPATFDHALTAFPLQGEHRGLDCAACHADGYTGTSSDCFACHGDDYQTVVDPNHVEAGFPTACETCHTESGWSPAEFEHDNTGFPLTGAHSPLECAACHAEGFAGTPEDCAACHQTEFQATVDPNHVAAGFASTCESCHSTAAWEPATFDHALTDFALTGSHTDLSCQACHAEGYTGTSTDCAACHQQAFDQTTDPPHATVGFSTTCEDCHTPVDWTSASFDHTSTGFPLQGAHVGPDCAACHSAGSAPPTDCYGCHAADFQSTTDPDHAAAGFETTCETCHSVTAWEPATFDHSRTDFALTGGHAGLDCLSCHAGGYTDTPTNCNACHADDFQSTVDPDHVGAGFPTTCQTCHTVNAWEPATFDHSTTDFALAGGHAGLDCSSCHANGYSGTPTDCFACHSDDYQDADDPDHADAGFPTACETCHSVNAWEPADFDHATYPLEGGHASVDCASCHVDGYTGTPRDCVACHQDDYTRTSDPDHADAGFPTTCETCHTTQGWEGAAFDHSQGSFPLVGAHRQVDCQACHTDGYTGTPTNCFACHQQQYDETRDPDHRNAGFPTACETCHTEQAWTPAEFDHNTTFFPLRGAHRTLDCLECHANGYSGTPTDCAACHLDDYQQTNDPNHASAGFPTTCDTCHDESGWDDADWDHDSQYFPIDSGEHRGAWTSCEDCHVAAGNFQVFECIFCHEHERSEMDDEHEDVGDYVYRSTACLTCHPDGEE